MTEKTEWRWLMFDKEGNFVPPHAARGRVRDAVVFDLEHRECRLFGDQGLRDLVIDQPGMICTTRPIEKFDFFGLELGIPSEDVGSFVLQLQDIKPRTVGDVTFYKMHGYLSILALSVDEYASLLSLLRNRLPEAERHASEFYAVRKLPSEVLREAAAASTGQPLEKIPNLGANKNDRFKLKPGAKA